MRSTPSSSGDGASSDLEASPQVIRQPWGWWAHLFLVHRDALDPLVEPRARRSVDFCLERARLSPGGRVLDVGCGAGRHALEMARRGMKVVGVDMAAPLVSYARERAAAEGLDVAFMHADWHDIEAGEGFHACLNLGVSFGYEGFDGDRRLLRRMADLLLPGGVLIIENDNPRSMLPGWIHDAVDIPSVGRLFMRRRWNDRSRCFQGNFRLETVDGVLIELEKPSSFRYDEVIHVYSLDEMTAMINQVGLKVTGVWGGCSLPLKKHDDESPRLVIEARKAP